MTATFRLPPRTDLRRRIIAWIEILIFLVFLFLAVVITPVWLGVTVFVAGMFLLVAVWLILKRFRAETRSEVVIAKKVPKSK
jgi:O-antigen/teichoic acid export membrane protein